jgi:CHAD domain-containing protein
MVSLDKKMLADVAFSLIGKDCLEQLQINQALMQSSNPEAVHRMRVALRRLRAAMGVFRPVLDSETSKRFAKEIRWIAGILGPARDLDVFLTETFPPVFEHLGHHLGLQELHNAAELARREAYIKVGVAINSPRYQKFLSSFDAWLQGMQASECPVKVKQVAEESLRKRYKKLLRYRHLTKHASSIERHRMRIAGKKLRYTMEFFDTLYKSGSSRKFLKKLVNLQATLGQLNDIAITTALVQKLAKRHPNKEVDVALNIFGS